MIIEPSDRTGTLICPNCKCWLYLGAESFGKRISKNKEYSIIKIKKKGK